jgi:hypothetical protein
MLYTVKIVDEGVITNDLHTNDYAEALQHESYAAKVYGKDNVWICDNIQEVMVG